MSLKNLSLKLLLAMLVFLPVISLSQDNIKVKMNLPLDKSGKFIYVDVDNPIQISASNYKTNDKIIHYSPNDLALRSRNAKVELIDQEKGIWNVRTKKTGKIEIHLYIRDTREKLETFMFHAKTK